MSRNPPADLLHYRAPWWLPGGHAQTIWAAVASRRHLGPAPRFVRERWDTPDGDFIELDWVDPPAPALAAQASLMQPQTGAPQPAPAPLFVLFHGLEGSSRSHYARSLMQAAALWVASGGWATAHAQARSNIVELRGDVLRNGEPLPACAVLLSPAVDCTLASLEYRQAAEAGLDWALYNYANLLATGRGVAEDQAHALRCYRQAAEQGHAKSMNLLGRYLEEGLVCQADLEAARDWYRRSAEGGDFRGQFSYAAVLADAGRIDEAVGWLQQALAGGNLNFLRVACAALLNALVFNLDAC